MFDSSFLSKYSQFIFDLDDTLIHEKEYLFPAYQCIAKKFGRNEMECESMFLFLKQKYLLGCRKNLFDSFIITYNLSPQVMTNILEELRNVEVIGGLNLTHEAKNVLWLVKKLKMNYIIITNGNPIQQANKLRQINWKDNLKPSKVVFANEFIPKPSPEVFFMLNKVKPFGKVLFIGDSEVDREFALNSGIDFFQIKCKWIES